MADDYDPIADAWASYGAAQDALKARHEAIMAAGAKRIKYFGEGGCDAVLIEGDCREILPALGRVGHVITDPPYSERTHAGHDAGARDGSDKSRRADLGYSALSISAAQELAASFNRHCNGWIVWLTDHSLAPHIQSKLELEGRYVFAPLPFFQAGRSVRLSGDGPCSWTDWIIVSRTAAQHKWGTLRGGYIAGEGWNDKQRMGGKPTRLMQLIVEDYSRFGDTVCDPFMGSGTTGVAALQLGRKFIGIEIDPGYFDIACKRIEEAWRQPRLFEEPKAKAEAAPSLFDGLPQGKR